MPESTNKESEALQKKKFTKEDILSAEDVGSTLEAYRRTMEYASDYEKIGLQSAVADRLHVLGEEEKSFQFTLLSAQTANTESIKLVPSHLSEVVNRLDGEMSYFDTIAGNFGGVARGMKAASEQIENSINNFSSTADKINQATNLMDKSARTIDGAASKIDSAAGTIHEASHRR